MHVTVLTHRNGFTPFIHNLLSHEVLIEGHPIRLPVGSMPILVLLERTYVAMCDATRVCNVHSCVTCSVMLLYCVQSGMYICCMMYPKDIVVIPVMLTPINVYFNRSDLWYTY